jgi:hypothetical protein
MKFTDNSNPSAAEADDTKIGELQAEMEDAKDNILNMVNDVARARTILAYDSDRRKQALSRAANPARAGGDSAAGAEMEARASGTYGKELDVLQKQYQSAEEIIQRRAAEDCRWETARSGLATQREIVKQL